MKHHHLFILWAFLPLLFSHCSKIYYPVTPAQATLIYGDRQHRASAAVGSSANGVHAFSAGYAQSISPKMSVFGTANWIKGAHHGDSGFGGDDFESGAYNFHIAAGRYKFIQNKFGKSPDDGTVFEAFGGLGMGKVNTAWTETDQFFSSTLLHGAGTFQYVQPFVQFNMGFIDPDMDFGVAFRASYLDYYKIRFEGDPMIVLGEYQSFTDRNNFFVKELTISQKLKIKRVLLGGYISVMQINRYLGPRAQIGVGVQYFWKRK